MTGCYRDDLALIGRALRDLIVEPHRTDLVPGFSDVQDAAMAAGALGCSLPGAGPTLFAWCDGPTDAAHVRNARIDAFDQHDIPTEGARVVKLSPTDQQSL